MKRSSILLALGFVTLAACSSSSPGNDGGGGGGGGTTGTGGAAGGEAGGTTGTGGTTTTGGTTGTGGTTATGGTTGAGGTNACTSIGHTGAGAPEVAGQGTFPTPAGGTTVDGTYDLKEFRIYPPGSVDAYIRHETIKLTGTKIEQAGVSTADDKEKFASGTFSTVGSTVTFMVTCPGVQAVALPYTATATELWLFDTSPGNMEVHVYTKRP